MPAAFRQFPLLDSAPLDMQSGTFINPKLHADINIESFDNCLELVIARCIGLEVIRIKLVQSTDIGIAFYNVSTPRLSDYSTDRGVLVIRNQCELWQSP